MWFSRFFCYQLIDRLIDKWFESFSPKIRGRIFSIIIHLFTLYSDWFAWVSGFARILAASHGQEWNPLTTNYINLLVARKRSRGWRAACVFHGYRSTWPGSRKAWKKKDYARLWAASWALRREYEMRTKAMRVTGTCFRTIRFSVSEFFLELNNHYFRKILEIFRQRII